MQSKTSKKGGWWSSFHTSSQLGPFARHGASCALPCTHVAAWCFDVFSTRVRGLIGLLASCPRRHGKSRQSCRSSELRRRVTDHTEHRPSGTAFLKGICFVCGRAQDAGAQSVEATKRQAMNLRSYTTCLNVVGHCAMCMLPAAALRLISSRPNVLSSPSRLRLSGVRNYSGSMASPRVSSAQVEIASPSQMEQAGAFFGADTEDGDTVLLHG